MSWSHGLGKTGEHSGMRKLSYEWPSLALGLKAFLGTLLSPSNKSLSSHFCWMWRFKRINSWMSSRITDLL